MLVDLPRFAPGSVTITWRIQNHRLISSARAAIPVGRTSKRLPVIHRTGAANNADNSAFRRAQATVFAAASTCVTASPTLRRRACCPPCKQTDSAHSPRCVPLNCPSIHSQQAACSGKTPTWPKSVGFNSNKRLWYPMFHVPSGSREDFHCPRWGPDFGVGSISNRASAVRDNSGFAGADWAAAGAGRSSTYFPNRSNFRPPPKSEQFVFIRFKHQKSSAETI